MKSIPAEILIYIFRLLHQHDKLQCMTVCHEWESVIKSTVLLETLSISSKKGLDSVISNVQREPSYGTQVKRLLFHMNPGEDFDLAILPKLFPKVLDFYINPAIALQPNCFDPWHNKLKHYFGGVFEDKVDLFGSNTWSNLTALELRAYSKTFNSKKYRKTLLNTPSLKYLTLSMMGLNIDNVEFIHSKLSSLKSLVLTEVTYTKVVLPKIIVPAPSVTSFSVIDSYVNGLLAKKKLLSYILQKYPNLSELSIGVFVRGKEDYYDDNPEFVRNEWDELLTNLAPRLQKLHLQLHSQGEYDYVLRALDKSNCRLKSLMLDDFLENEAVNLLPDLNQSRYLQSLNIIDYGERMYQRLSSMKMLTEIDLVVDDSSRETAYFNDILDMCGENLQSLKITNLELKCRTRNRKNSSSSIFHQIKKLEFTDVRLAPSIGIFISKSCPQLHTLKFRNCFKDIREFTDEKGKELFITMPTTNLRYLQIVDKFDPDGYILVLTRCNNEKRIYTIKNGNEIAWEDMEEDFGLRDSSIFPPTLFMNYNEKAISPIVTITCNSTKDIFLSGM